MDDAAYDFARNLQIKMSLYLPQRYSSYKTVLSKGASGYELKLEDGMERLAAMPCLSVGPLYEKQGDHPLEQSIQDAVFHYVAAYEQAVESDTREMARFQSFMNEYPEEKIFYTLVMSGVQLSEVMADYPCRKCGDAIMVYSVMMDHTVKQMKSFAITNKLAEKWEKKEEELYEAAQSNTPLLFPYEIDRIEIYPDVTLYMTSSRHGIFGLGTLFYKEGPLKEIAAETDSDLMVVPLSIHEAAVFACNARIREPDLYEVMKNYVPCVNRMYLYCKKMNRIAVNERERLELNAVLRYGILDAAEKHMTKTDHYG